MGISTVHISIRHHYHPIATGGGGYPQFLDDTETARYESAFVHMAYNKYLYKSVFL